ncbi:homocysteine S-methyltransferase family protein [Emcibacter sp.]|uniref:homocysteine S-methyltransferase family protein n=1 Tax=Emcibacter sp. TaxID=1979954 RepID=UPI003A9122D0
MGKYSHNLPQMEGGLFLTDGGLETTLIFDNGFDLPEFAAFPLLDTEEGFRALYNYYLNYVQIACDNGMGFVLESPTYKASPNWARALGVSDDDLRRLNHKSIEMLKNIREKFETPESRFVISGNLGPAGDGYNPDQLLSVQQAREYHSVQIGHMAEVGVDMVAAFTLTHAEEAAGVVLAARDHDLPVAISFTLETDGRLPSGQSLREAIEYVDSKTGNGPAYYMINCAHPTHFDFILEGGPWLDRIRGLRTNASTKSHEELEASEELDAGDPQDLGVRHVDLKDRLSNLAVVGGCCGTDHRHVAEICRNLQG